MTKFGLILSLLVLSISSQNSNTTFIYPELDADLLKVWTSSIDQDYDQCNNALVAVFEEWTQVEKGFNGWHYSLVDLDAFGKEVTNSIAMMEYHLIKKQYDNVEHISYGLLWKFKLLRDCVLVHDYPLDQLLDLHNAYTEIEYTVNDKMFGLYEWFEFEDILCEFNEYLAYYKLNNENQIEEHFPKLYLQNHAAQLLKLESCLEEFERSLESGFQSDFVLPCNELGIAIKEMLLLYSNKNNVI